MWLGISVGIVLVALIVLFVAMHSGPEDYNGFPVTSSACPGVDRTCAFVSFQIRDTPYTIPFYNHPREVEALAVAPEAVSALVKMSRIENGTVVIAFPKDAPGEIGVAGAQLGRIIGDRYGIMNLNVVPTPVENRAQACSYARPQQLITYFEAGPLDAVILVGPNCVVISAVDGKGATRAAEAYTYHVLGVIPTRAS
jgi:hypothetical protein